MLEGDWWSPSLALRPAEKKRFIQVNRNWHDRWVLNAGPTFFADTNGCLVWYWTETWQNGNKSFKHTEHHAGAVGRDGLALKTPILPPEYLSCPSQKNIPQQETLLFGACSVCWKLCLTFSKFQFPLLSIYFRLSGFRSSFVLIHSATVHSGTGPIW